MEKKEMTAEVRSLALKIFETALIYNSTPTEQEYTGEKPTFFVKFSGHCSVLDVQCYPNGYDKHSLFFYVGGNVLYPLCESENRSESDIINTLETILEEMGEIYKHWQKKEELKNV